MELRQLQYLVAVVEEQSFTKTAPPLHVAQPWVSAQVRQLETELGQTLVDRSPGGVRPTVVGAAVLPHAARRGSRQSQRSATPSTSSSACWAAT